MSSIERRPVRSDLRWEGDSVDAVRDHVDSTLGDAAEPSYFKVDPEQARGLAGGGRCRLRCRAAPSPASALSAASR